MRGVLAAVLCAGVLAACSSPVQGEPAPDAAGGGQVDLAELRDRYGLLDCPATDPEAGQIEDGLPQTALPCLGTDQPVNLAGLTREPWVINLWAQWCPPCREESPVLREGLAEIEGVNFLGVNYNDPQPDWAIEFVDAAGWAYPHVQDMDKSLQVPLRVTGLPTTVFVAADGTVAYVHPGALTSVKQLEELVSEHLGVG